MANKVLLERAMLLFARQGSHFSRFFMTGESVSLCDLFQNNSGWDLF